MAEQRDVIAVLTHDHREVEQMFSELESMRGAIGERPKLLAENVVIELVRHSVAEEQYLYPAVREHVPGGDELADYEIAEHAAAERTMHDLEHLEPGDDRFWPELDRLMAEVRHHLREEEDELFPRLREACDQAQLEELGAKVERAKKTAPTRPHPYAPDTPPGNRLLMPGAGLVDRIRDAITGRGRSS
ncbi:hemerythrin domain-containing protein [Nonomuraea wenchangensis]|uniref:Hemerythrin HHE cation binding domain-containing protein n=1 Tax=Nonomuraea wenchangensis TaxID=568860 RepID=A0A1I0KKQ3_9ACTN|nr:hemerythrin domain-containing protein [Nonomuraea wenchangensis]SEU25613.1 Hemerythrin HHE cation binding domain-containing protein [Nonomuraea wenchangensis]